MAASAWVVHNKIKEYAGNGVVNFDTDTFKMTLHNNTGGGVSTASTTGIASCTDQLSTAVGYTSGGTTVAGTWAESSGTVTFDTADGVWTAAGGSIVARYAAIYDDTISSPVADPIVCHSLLDSTPADVTATDGNTFTVQINASGVFTLV